MTDRDSLVQAAIAYAQAGWRILPLRPRGKAPLTRHGFKDATSDLATVRSFWRRWPGANIGLALPRGLIVVDFDSGEALESIRAQDFVLPSTVRAKTARGWHLWYSLRQRVRGQLMAGVDIKKEGGYVVVPPSIHPTGKVYRWIEPLQPSAISQCPAWLADRISTAQAPQPQGRPPESWAQRISKKVPQGERNNRLAEVSGLLFRRLPTEVAEELAYCWARSKMQPPLPDHKIRRTLDSIAGRELRRRQANRR